MTQESYENILRELELSVTPELQQIFKYHYRHYLKLEGEVLAWRQAGTSVTVNITKDPDV